jgi:hypothetical protein
MRLLFIAFPDSIHTVRWINQIAGSGWDIHLFPSRPASVDPQMRNITIHHQILRNRGTHASVNTPRALRFPLGQWEPYVNLVQQKIRSAKVFANYRRKPSITLANLIRRLQPDLVHSLELQHAGYLTLEARKLMGDWFPKWAVSNWGSDIYLFGRLPEHRDKIRQIMTTCDYYACEGQRDLELGRQFGFKGEAFPVVPNTGGFDLPAIAKLRQDGSTSRRTVILLKGYQSWAGRALVGIEALRRCADVLRGYQIRIYLSNPDVDLAANLLAADTGLDVGVIPTCSHKEMLRWHGRARVSIGLSISDAISTSFLEALVMGSFPIQSDTSMANEWVTDGESGYIVPPEDPEKIATAIRHAVTDDTLVNRAAEINAQTAKTRLDQNVIAPQVVAMYEKILF